MICTLHDAVANCSTIGKFACFIHMLPFVDSPGKTVVKKLLFQVVKDVTDF